LFQFRLLRDAAVAIIAIVVAAITYLTWLRDHRIHAVDLSFNVSPEPMSMLLSVVFLLKGLQIVKPINTPLLYKEFAPCRFFEKRTSATVFLPEKEFIALLL